MYWTVIVALAKINNILYITIQIKSNYKIYTVEGLFSIKENRFDIISKGFSFPQLFENWDETITKISFYLLSLENIYM